MTLKFWDTESLQAAISDVTEDSRGRHFMKHTRRLFIVCLVNGAEETMQWKLEPWATGLVIDQEPAPRNSFLDYWLTTYNPLPGSKVLINQYGGLYRDRNWTPIESLITRLDRLERLDFFTNNEFTSGLERAISQHHPYCRVNIVWRQAIAYGVLNREAKELNPGGYWSHYEFDANVLKLPGLHTLAVDLVHNESRLAGREDLDEMLPLLVNAPGLKHLDLQAKSSISKFPTARLREKWQALVDTCLSTQTISPLESITISGAGLREDILFKVAAAGNLSNLRTLVLEHIFDPAGLVKTAGLFPNLERLFIDPNPLGRRWMHLKTDHDDLIAAIRAFPPLKYLCLHTLRTAESLLRIVERHGPSLKGLIVEPSSSAQSQYPRLDIPLLVQLAAYCPSLEELRLQIQRSAGSQAECDIYRALGEFSNLHSLVLDLRIDARPELPRQYFDTEYLTVLRKTFINAATDEELALGIWNTIKSDKASRLQYLRVVPFGNEMFSDEESYLIDCFARSLLVTRYDVHNPGSPKVEEIGTRVREIRRDKFRPAKLPERLTLLLHDIWPQVPEGSDSWSGWNSYPLEAETT